eukprot:11191895-Alexandrium_andersonii.AAC.1
MELQAWLSPAAAQVDALLGAHVAQWMCRLRVRCRRGACCCWCCLCRVGCLRCMDGVLGR